MKKKLIRLTEGDLHRIIKECVGRIITEHDPDDPDYGQYGDYYDAQHYLHDCEMECSLCYWLNPATKQIVRDGEESENDVMFVIWPKFDPQSDEYGFEIEDMDFEFDTGNKQKDGMYMEEFGDLVDKYIDDNADSIYELMKKNSTYHIY